MKTIHIEKREINRKDFKKRHALDADVGRKIDEPCQIFLDGELSMIYEDFEGDVDGLFKACESIKFGVGWRTSGMRTHSRVFGYEPRKTMRKDYCGATLLSREHPDEHSVVVSQGEELAKQYARGNPKLYEHHLGLTTENVHEDWRLHKMPFTSGIINRDNLLEYHFDAGNFRDVWSGMIVLKHGIIGGHLNLPELDIALTLRHGTCVFFNGQGLLHGVTPITKLMQGAVRYSLVYYSLQGMWQCLPIGDEINRIRERRTKYEVEPRKKKNVDKIKDDADKKP